MNFSLSDEQQLIKDTIRKFMTRECPRDVARALEEQETFPGELLQKLAGSGFCGLNVPEEHGGGGQNLLGAAIIVEELASLCPTLAGAFTGVVFRGGQVIAALGSQAQKQELLPGIARGELLFTHALVEPALPFSVDTIQTTALEESATFVLTGTKAFVSLTGRAHYLLTLARTGEGSSIFVVPANAPGIESRPIETVGYRSAGSGEVIFHEVPVAAADLLGGPDQLGRGAEQARYLVAVDHLALAASGLGIARGAYEYALTYAGERVQFGQAITQFEAIQHMLVDLAIEIRATRLLLHQACWQGDQGHPFHLEAAMARVRAGDLARQAALQGVHILGGYGYMAEYDAERYVRDSLVLFSGNETTELLKSSVGALLGLGQKD